MQIKEVQEKLDISSYTLRYYEKMGLIKPFRDDNGYRNYSENDIKILKKIRFLRELEIPIEDIQSIIEGNTTFQNVLDEHMKKIDIQMRSLQYVKDICEDLKEKDIPILEAMTDEKIISEENINQTDAKNSMKKLFDYLKPVKTVIIGYRVGIRDFLSFLPFDILFSVLFGAMLGIGIPNLINYINKSFENTPKKIYIPIYNPSLVSFLVATIVLFVVFLIGIAWYDTKQDYIELLDNYISICSYKHQNRLLILKSMLTKKDNPSNIRYFWKELNYVKIQLYFQNTSAGRGGLCTVYIPEFTFYFKDGFQYEISSGLSFGEDTKTAYQILRSKNIEIIAENYMIDYFEQNEIKGYDYFEKIFHKNSKKS